MIKIIASATATDASICNVLEPPAKGCQSGRGTQIDIPPDWQDRIASGKDVPGCTYARLESDGSLSVDDRIQINASRQDLVNNLTTDQRSQVAQLNVKLATAIIADSLEVPDAPVAT